MRGTAHAVGQPKGLSKHHRAYCIQLLLSSQFCSTSAVAASSRILSKDHTPSPATPGAGWALEPGKDILKYEEKRARGRLQTHPAVAEALVRERDSETAAGMLAPTRIEAADRQLWASSCSRTCWLRASSCSRTCSRNTGGRVNPDPLARPWPCEIGIPALARDSLSS